MNVFDLATVWWAVADHLAKVEELFVDPTSSNSKCS